MKKAPQLDVVFMHAVVIASFAGQPPRIVPHNPLAQAPSPGIRSMPTPTPMATANSLRKRHLHSPRKRRLRYKPTSTFQGKCTRQCPVPRRVRGPPVSQAPKHVREDWPGWSKAHLRAEPGAAVPLRSPRSDPQPPPRPAVRTQGRPRLVHARMSPCERHV